GSPRPSRPAPSGPSGSWSASPSPASQPLWAWSAATSSRRWTPPRRRQPSDQSPPRARSNNRARGARRGEDKDVSPTASGRRTYAVASVRSVVLLEAKPRVATCPPPRTRPRDPATQPNRERPLLTPNARKGGRFIRRPAQDIRGAIRGEAEGSDALSAPK